VASLDILPKVGRPNVAALFAAIAQSGRLPLSGAARLAPPMSFSHHRALFLFAAYDSGATYVDGRRGSLDTLLSLGTLLTTALFSNSTLSFTIAVPVEEALVVAFFHRWNRGTCLHPLKA